MGARSAIGGYVVFWPASARSWLSRYLHCTFQTGN